MNGDMTTEEHLRSHILSLQDNVLKEYLVKIGARPVQERRQNMEKLIKWLDETLKDICTTNKG
jgi:hypothetical protein